MPNMSLPLLVTLESPTDLKKLNRRQLPQVASEIRQLILETTNQNGGHLGSGLGVVELTIALHYLFDSPNDQIVWDVGHQSYPHKILTGRRREFATIKLPHGLSGFPTRIESEHDSFGVGHSSTAISAATGLAIAKRLQNKSSLTITVVGDASLTGGLSLEGLNHLADLNENVLIIVNINDISIDPHQGKVAKSALYQKFIAGFGLELENQGQPIDGHNFAELLKHLNQIKKSALTKPKTRVLLVKTVKGQGYQPAIDSPTEYHGVKAGFLDQKNTSRPKTVIQDWSDVAGQTLYQLMKKDSKIVVICPAMASRSGLQTIMTDFPERFFDPGIVEQHALTLAAGLAANNLKPFVVIASTFLQRAYDQLVHDICLQKLPVTLLIDRTGESCDGPTHSGILDLQFLSGLPHLEVIAPCSSPELSLAIKHAHRQNHAPVAIRFPKIKVAASADSTTNTSQITHLQPFYHVKTILESTSTTAHLKVAWLYFGKTQSSTVRDQITLYHQKFETDPQTKIIDLYHCQFLKPFPEIDFAQNIFPHYDYLITTEDGVTEGGGFGARVAQAAAKHHYSGQLINLGL